MLLNNNVQDIDKEERNIIKMFERTYRTIPDITNQ
jgi:hypothetical protein